jgi:hypothetical protein
LCDELGSILVSTAALGVCAVVAAVLTAVRGPIATSAAELRSAVRMAILVTLLQSAHFSEELGTGFASRYPELLGLAPLPSAFFISFNAFWIAVWAFSCWGLANRLRLALFPLWFLGIACLLNGLAHPAFALLTGGYFPGLITSAFIGAAGFLLIRRLARVTDDPPR